MALIEWHTDLPPNIVALPSHQHRQIRHHYEHGDVVVLTDLRINADFSFLSQIEPPRQVAARKDKYVFSKNVNGKRECRISKWKTFSEEAFSNDFENRERFYLEMQRVEKQIDAISRKIFRNQRFSRDFICWKFQRIEGENLHIDNLRGANDCAQLRIFANMDVNPRLWSVGAHWRHYAERFFEKAALAEVVNDAFALNGRLTHAAFGPSYGDCNEPRHLVEFEPGEVWLANSSLVAHQVRKGRLLCTGHYEYPYGRCLDIRETLPEQINALARRQAGLPSDARALPKRMPASLVSIFKWW